MIEQFDVVVLGGGTAGLVTASGCARLGRKVALVEKAALGGDCLWTGCVPTKALVASARLAHQAAHADAWGFAPSPLTIDPKRVMDSMRQARAAITHHDDPDKFRALGIDVIFGEGHFLDRRRIEVAGRQLQAKDVVIATGSRTSVPAIPGLEEAGYLDHVSFLDRDQFPGSIAILGGGSIGVEFAQIFRRFGCEVTIIEMAGELVSREDPDIIAFVGKLLANEGIAIRTGWAATAVRTAPQGKTLSIERKDGTKDEVTASEIFVASGRKGNVEGLALEASGVKVARSYVAVDRYLETNVARVWACGDVHGGLQFTHVAAYEAVKLVRNMLFPFKSATDYSNIPWALFTDPEIGHAGMTEPEAVVQMGRSNVRTFRVEMAEVDRAVVDRTPSGFVKFICDNKGTILGCHAASSNASTLIEEVVLARRKGVKIGELAQMTSPYPSLSDAIQKTAALYYSDLSSGWLGRVGRKVAAWTQ